MINKYIALVNLTNFNQNIVSVIIHKKVNNKNTFNSVGPEIILTLLLGSVNRAMFCL